MPDAEPAPEPVLRVERLGLRAGSRRLVHDLSFELAAGERLVLVGSNGSGKSTLLAALAGLAEPQTGHVKRPARPPGVLFQDGALWPHMSVAEHLAFADAGGNRAWQSHLLDVHRLTSLRDHRPEQLSGGERLRLGLARALANRPSWVLLDEPLAHLDPESVHVVRDRLPLLLDELGAASITVLHDPDDVLLFGQRMLALEGNGHWWLGPARFAVESPPTASLAAFSDRGTLLEAKVDDDGVADFGCGLIVREQPVGQRRRAFLDAAAVHLASDADDAHDAVFVAPDRRGGSWVRVDGRLLRCAAQRGPLHAGDPVRVVVRGQVRVLDDGAPT
ncbi:MAG: hypothetical protein DHS20C15_00250 [Planctomycetota bacterium]|nr:MAG: hypothetical protein DHS20C15_00250 [Planctomycetota bacterium]